MNAVHRGQQAFPFEPPAPDYSEPAFLVVDANRRVFDALFAAPAFAAASLVFGQPASGKTHLASIWAERRGAGLLHARAEALAGAVGSDAPLVVDNMEAGLDPTLFLSLLKQAEAGRAVLLAGRGEPQDWARGVRDLQTRLAACRRVEIPAPDDALVKGLLRKQLEDRGLSVSAQALAFAAARAPRSHEGIAALVERVDRRMMETATGRAVSMETLRISLDADRSAP